MSEFENLTEFHAKNGMKNGNFKQIFILLGGAADLSCGALLLGLLWRDR